MGVAALHGEDFPFCYLYGVNQTQQALKCRAFPCKSARLYWLLLKSTYSKPDTSWHHTTARRDLILIFIHLLAYEPVG